MNAKSSLCMVSEDEIKWAQQNSIFKAQRDYNTGMQNAEKRGIRKGAQQTAIANARSFYENGVSVEIIAKSLGMSIEQVREITADVVQA